MGTVEMFLCFFVGYFIPVHSVIEPDAAFSPAFPGFFENILRFPFERNFDFPPYDTIFSSRRTWTPDFHMLAELPPIMTVPKVQVSCDESQLTLLVDKRFYGGVLNGEEIHLGDDCYSNRELPNQFVFTYSFDQCGTTHSMQNGLVMFSNVLHLNLHKPPSTRWITPPTLHISCTPKRSNPNFFAALPEKGRSFDIKAMNPSWSSTAESNIYKRGQVVSLQVSAKTRADQQLFIQSCFVSASPEPQTRPRHAVILNKGCTAPLGSLHAVIQFEASNRADVVNVALNTSYLISEMYIHCSVLISDQGVTTGSKSCNYNSMQSRWEELSGNIEVCSCCNSKCKGLSVKHLSDDARAMVSTGPLIIVNKEDEISPAPSNSEPQETSSTPVTDSVQSDAAAPEDTIVFDTSVSRSKFSEPLWSSPPQGVVVVSQEPVARLTVWLPGQVQDTEEPQEHSSNISSEVVDNWTAPLQPSDVISSDLPELQPSITDQESVLDTPTNEIRGESPNKLENDAPALDLNAMMMLDGWALPPQQDKEVFAEESKRRNWFRGSDTEALPAEIIINDQNDFNQMSDEPCQRQADAAIMHQDGTNDSQPIMRSKLQFSKDTDGSQMLSYEEEVVKQHEGKGATRRFGTDAIKGKQAPGQKGLLSTFLALLRSMDKAE